MKLSVFVFKFIDYTFDYVQNYYKYANIKTIKDVSYDDRSEACKLDILVKDGAEGPFPVYMNIHGGGYVAGDKKHRRSFCSHIASRGYFVFNINHGLSPEYKYPDQVRHCLNALNWIYDQKDRYNLDVDRILVGGDSAGGYLSALLGVIATNEVFRKKLNFPEPKVKIKGLILISAPYDLTKLLAMRVPFKIAAELGELMTGIPKKRIYNNPEAFKDYQYVEAFTLIKHVTEKFPPCLIMHSTKDFFVPRQGDELVKILKEKGVKHYEHKATRFVDIHCYPIFRFLKSSKESIKLIDGFLEEMSETE